VLSEYGAACLEAPTIEIQPPDDGYAALDEAIRTLESFQWLIFTSPNGVDAFFQRLFAGQQDVRALGRCRLAAIGAATAQALRERGLMADVVPADFRAEALAASLAPLVQPGQRLLLPRAQEAREVLPQELVQRGAAVLVAPSYKAVPPPALPPATAAALQQGDVDVLTFASSSTVTNFVRLVGQEQFDRLASRAVIAAIGPITAQTLAKFGHPPQIQPAIYTIPALAAAIVEYFHRSSP
ncbi:MAG: uroporphyrinogen-III synthase, partial [Desulfobacca sp.]|uniref:uroporphyrinogen-III synthase n=1 Tax=Desulfobacca sp. TaxID=2067990 RepID=UPI00404B4C24